MANNKVKVDVVVDDNGSLKQTGSKAKKTAADLNKAGNSAQSFDRKMKGASGASSNASKNFSKMAQSSGGIAGIYAQIAANVFAVSAAFQFLKTSADVSKLIKGQEALGSVSGVAYKTITKSIQEATGAQLAYQEAAQASAIGVAAGLSASQLEQLGKAARNTSTALGRDLTDSFNRLIRGVTKAEPELLDELGIVLRLAPATQKYAQAIGKTANELNAFERTQAVANEVLEQTEEKFGKIAAIMDPSGESLNRFLVSFDNLLIKIRSGLISGLGPVFDFLSNNTGALIVAMGAISALVVKSLIPDFGKYADAAKASGFKIKRSLVEQRKELQRINAQYATLSDRAQLAANKSVASFSKIAKSKGLGEGEAGGRKALDFLSGASNSKAAQRNAKRSVDAAIKAMENGNKVKVDLLKDFSKEELRIAQDSLNKQLKLEKIKEQAVQQTHGRIGLSLQKLKAQVMLTFNGLGAFMVAWAGKTAAAINFALTAVGWIGAIVALVSILKTAAESAYNFFFPASEAAKAADKETKAYLDTMSSLNEELSRMVKVRTEIELTTRALVEQAGQAAASADAVSKALKLINLSELASQGLVDADAYDKASQQFRTMLGNLEQLAPELKTVVDLFDETGNIDVKALQQFQNQAISFSTASSELSRNLKSLKTEIVNVVGSIPKSPFENLLKATNTALKNSQTLDAGLNKEVSRKILNLQKQRKEIKDSEGDFMSPDAIIQYSQLGGEIEKARKEQANIGKQTKYLLSLSQNLAAVQKDVTDLSTKNAKAVKDAALGQVVEYSLLDKKSNLIAKSLTIENDLRSAKQKQIVAEATLKAAIDNKDAKAIANAALQLGLATENVSTEKAKADLKKEQHDLQVALVQLEIDYGLTSLQNQQRLNDLKSQELGFEKQLADLEVQKNDRIEKRLRMSLDASIRENKKDVPLGLGTLGREQYRQEEELRIQQLVAKNKLDAAEATRDLKLQELQMEQDMFDIKMSLLKLEFAKLNKEQKTPGINKDTGLTDEQQTLFGRLEGTANTLFDAKGTAIRDIFKLAGEEFTEATAKIKEAEYALTDVGKIQNVISDNFEKGLAGAFSDIVTGTKSVKEAFSDMAMNILKRLADVVAELLIVKTIQSSLGMLGFATPIQSAANAASSTMASNASAAVNANLGSITIQPPTLRTGGVVNSSGKLPGYAIGGVSKGPQSGYPVELHGTEAIVPLPNGKSIPVEMKQGGGTNNVVVNVSVDNQGNAQTTTESQTSQDAGRLGQLVSQAVQRELQNQKRSGGILNPYGAS